MKDTITRSECEALVKKVDALAFHDGFEIGRDEAVSHFDAKDFDDACADVCNECREAEDFDAAFSAGYDAGYIEAMRLVANFADDQALVAEDSRDGEDSTDVASQG